MPAAAIVGGVASVVGGAIASRGAKSAANAQANASRDAMAVQERIYQQQRADAEPWRQAGMGALERLNSASTGDMSNFFASPDYNFRRNEGQRDIGNSFAARGGAASGNALRALSEFNSSMASSEYGNWWNRQAGLAGVGQQANTQIGHAGQNYANQSGNALMQAGDARASGVAGSANAWGGALSNAVNTWAYFRKPQDELQPVDTSWARRM